MTGFYRLPESESALGECPASPCKDVVAVTHDRALVDALRAGNVIERRAVATHAVVAVAVIDEIRRRIRWTAVSESRRDSLGISDCHALSVLAGEVVAELVSIFSERPVCLKPRG